MHKFGVVLGRFQPFHNGHKALIEGALEHAENVIVLVGSHESASTIKNPFNAIQRAELIDHSFAFGQARRLTFQFIHDHLYDERSWVSEVRQTVEKIVGDSEDVALIGHNKDRTSYYLALFPDWEQISIPLQNDGVSATDVRVAVYEGDWDFVKAHTPKVVFDFLFKKDSDGGFDDLRKEYVFVKNYHASWVNSPYPPNLVTADAVTTCSDYVLLVKRKGYPGNGLWAIPGGHVEQHETVLTAAYRELWEETGISDGIQRLGSHVFDHPDRSLLGRCITHAQHFELRELTPPKAGDDAAESRWFPRHKIKSMRSQLFDDHWHILQFFLRSI